MSKSSIRRPVHVGFREIKPSKKQQRVLKAMEKIRYRKLSEISKSNAVQYSTSAFIMAMSELYGWKSVRSGRVINEAMEKWSEYTKEDEHKLIESAKNLGVDIEAVTNLCLDDRSKCTLNITDGTFDNFKQAIKDIHLMFAACLVVLHDYHRFGDARLNNVMLRMWEKYQQACKDDGKSIMQMCEEETGICVVGGEEDAAM